MERENRTKKSGNVGEMIQGGRTEKKGECRNKRGNRRKSEVKKSRGNDTKEKKRYRKKKKMLR